jgi:hypothetical protein
MIRFFFYFNFINVRNGNYKKIYKELTQPNNKLINNDYEKIQINLQNKYLKFLQKDQHKLKLQYPPYSI